MSTADGRPQTRWEQCNSVSYYKYRPEATGRCELDTLIGRTRPAPAEPHEVGSCHHNDKEMGRPHWRPVEVGCHYHRPVRLSYIAKAPSIRRASPVLIFSIAKAPWTTRDKAQGKGLGREV